VSPTRSQTWSEDLAKLVFAHELGHAHGIEHATGCNQTDSLMLGEPSRFSDFTCSPTSCDRTAYNSQYPPPSAPPQNECTVWDCYSPNYNTCTCDDPPQNPLSPIILAIGTSSAYHLAGSEDGVWFDLNADGALDRIGWTRADDLVGFLALDRNGNGIIDDGRELFGNFTPLAADHTANHGFEALEFFDRPEAGGNGDGWIDASDAVWSDLLVWLDLNHDGLSQPSELFSVASLDIKRISTLAWPELRSDRYGNVFRWRGTFVIGNSARSAYDVYFSVGDRRYFQKLEQPRCPR
jgi:hypothetical protein